MVKRSTRTQKKLKIKAGYVGLLLLLGFFLFRSFTNSLLFSRPDRINLIFYKEKPTLISLGRGDNVNYIVGFYPDLKIRVPGGYGEYRVGALGKLVYLEKKPQIMQKAFSSASSALVNLYFYQGKGDVFYGKDSQKDVNLPGYNELVFSKSNATIFDRIYLIIVFSLAKKNDFTLLDPVVRTEQGDRVFQEDEFAKEYEGFFYHQSYRRERKTVQIVYTESSKNAALVSRILENSGIRVVDNLYSDSVQKNCSIIEDREFSRTAKDLSGFFGCPLKRGETKVSDIIIQLGSKEKDWAYQ